MGRHSASAFALAFASSTAANGILSEAYAKGEIGQKELIISNIFNSFPAYILHAPTIFLLIWPAIGWPAASYVGITLMAAFLRMGCGAVAGHYLLPVPAPISTRPAGKNFLPLPGRLKVAFAKAWARFRKRLAKLALITIPCYICAWLCQRLGYFQLAETWLGAHLDWLSFLKPEAMALVVVQMSAEMGATAAIAAAAMHGGALSGPDIVLALLAGNILGTPIRALRHQLPAYAGFYRPGMALKLICSNQLARATSLALFTGLYLLFLKLIAR